MCTSLPVFTWMLETEFRFYVCSTNMWLTGPSQPSLKNIFNYQPLTPVFPGIFPFLWCVINTLTMSSHVSPVPSLVDAKKPLYRDAIPHASPGVKGLTALKTLKSAPWARHLQSSALEREVPSLEGRKTLCFVKMEKKKVVFSFYYEVVVIIVEALNYSGIPPSQLRDNTFSTLVYIIFFLCFYIFKKN